MLIQRNLFNRLISYRTTPISLHPIYHRVLCFSFVVDPSHFFLTKGISTSPNGGSKQTKPKSLSSIFTNPSAKSQSKTQSHSNNAKAKKGNRDENKLSKITKSSGFYTLKERKFPLELSPEANLLLKRLQEECYLNMEFSQMQANLSSRDLLKSAAEKLGQRHQEIAKWLSGSDLKKVALFGCPSIERETVFAAKRLRSFFSIQEDIICRGCKIKTSCKYVNQRVDKVEKVILSDVMRLLAILAFNAFPPQLSVSADLKLSVDKLLKEAVNLSA